MKVAILASLTLLASTASHAEFRDNPDRFPSLGINYTTNNLGGDRAEKDLPSNPAVWRTQTGHTDLHFQSIGADFRLPVSQSVTFDIGAASLAGDSKFIRQGDVYEENQSLTGYSLSFGARLYFNH